MNDLLTNMTDKSKLMALLEKRETGKTRKINEDEMNTALKSYVKGQDHVIHDISKLIRLQWGKEMRKKPIANILFLGPTGTGKTELTKAMANYLFGDENAMLRFDCSEFTGGESKTKLIGTPTGYVGSSSGGQLTRPVINNPKRLVLFDEVEKAFNGIFDLFLQMMGDGRLTEQGSGKTADFTQSIIVLTSNAEHEAIGKIQDEISDYHEMVNAVKSHLADTKIFRPEIVGRFDRVYVFKSLEGIVIAEIAILKMVKLAKEYGLELAYVDPDLVYDAMIANDKTKSFGIRQLETTIGDMLGEAMYQAKEAGAKKIRLDIDSNGDLEINPDD